MSTSARRRAAADHRAALGLIGAKLTPIGAANARWNREPRLETRRVDRDRGRQVAADEDRPQQVRLEAPAIVVAEDAASLEIGDHRRRPRTKDRCPTIGTVKVQNPAHTGRAGP